MSFFPDNLLAGTEGGDQMIDDQRLFGN